jgi:hypothetical protein
MGNDPHVFEGACAICKTRKAVRWCDFVIQYNRYVTFYRDHELMVNANSSPNDETCDLPLCENELTKKEKRIFALIIINFIRWLNCLNI